MALGNFRGLDFIRTANELAVMAGFGGLFGSEGIDVIRNIDWASKHLWAVRFMEPKPPDPFKNYFPASDITVMDGTLDSFNVEQAQGFYKIPQKSAATKQISITFFDDYQNNLQRWFSDWMNIDIQNDGRFMSCLLDDHAPVKTRTVKFDEGERVWPIRKLEFFRLSRDLEPIVGTERIYTVYPEGELNIEGSSQSEANTFNMTLVAVNEARPVKEKESSDNAFLRLAKREATRLLGRFT